MAGMALTDVDMMFLGSGLSKNSTLTKLVLRENEISDPKCLKSLCDGLANSKQDPRVVDLDLQKCGLQCSSLPALVMLLSRKYKLRSLNLRDNGISDEGAHSLLSALKINPYLSKIDLGLNPARLNIV